MEGAEVDTGPSSNSDSTPKQEQKSRFALFALADRFDYLLMLVGSIGAFVHGAAFPLFLLEFGRMIQSLGTLMQDPEKMGGKISQNALEFVYLGIINFVAAWIEVAFWMQTGERQSTRMRLRYLQAILRKDISFFDTEAKDENVIFRISSDIILVQDAIGDKIGHCLRYVAQFVAGFTLAFVSVWQLTLVTLAVVPLIVIAGSVNAVTLSNLSKKNEAAYAEGGRVAEEVISHIRTVYSFSGEEKAVKLYSDSLEKALKLGKKGGIVKGLGIGSTFGLLFCAWALLLWYAGVIVRHEVANGGEAFTTIINVVFSGFGLGQAAPCISALARGQAAASNMMRTITNSSNSSRNSDDGIMVSEVVGQIEFCQVSFSYQSRSTIIFDNLSFSIGAGKTCAFVGPSGSGKSTIISLVERFYDPTSGQILLDGHDLRSLQLKWLRHQIGLVNQEPTLFATSIVENILYGEEDADMDRVVEAAKAANAHSFIQALPEAYHTLVGEAGIQLSGGQKQRIAIARALLRKPKILLLDEATSALDAESEFVVQQAMERIMVGRTTIVVAHRLSTIHDVDTIIVLKNGSVVESGTHSELMSMGGEYSSLVRLQVSETDRYQKQQSYREPMDSSELLITQTVAQKTLPVKSSDENTSRCQHNQLRNVPEPSFRKLIKLNAPEWPLAALGSIGAILSGIERPLFAFGLAEVLTLFYSPDKLYLKHQLDKISLIFVGAAIAIVPIYLLQYYFYTLMGERLVTRVRLLMFSAILRNEIGWFDMDEHSSGSLASTLAAAATILRSSLSDRLCTVTQHVSLIVTAFLIALVVNWQMASVAISTLPLLICSTLAEQLSLKGFGGDYTRAYSRATSIAREAIINIRTVASLNAEDRTTAQFASELYLPSKHALVRGHISGIGYGLSQFFAFSSYALAIWYASELIKHKEATFGNCMKAFLVIVITAFAFAEAVGFAPDAIKGSQALKSIWNIIDRKTQIDPDDPTSDLVEKMQGDIDFKNVYFRYPARPDVTVLEGVNLNVAAGSSLALVGPSGSGKSSMIALLMRFYDPSSGVIFIDGMDIRGLNLRSLRLKIGLVQQEPALFSTTIYENIKYGKEGASEIEIMDAAKAANAHEFIGSLPQGYQTQVGERGVQLSGGQKQRVAIARAIIKDPGILVLDEATSALDSASEKLVQQALDKLMEGRTTIVVAHRLSTIQNANRICVLQFGKVIESGSHNELINRSGGVYKHLVSLNQSNH
ncbi:ABC transporter B family member 13-like [Aristolochia californica]|uniref:ABC transporter B family member 13-like n=1 Tax=Aristolochia californica TaxID=171875 RepID=UPI0035D9475F